MLKLKKAISVVLVFICVTFSASCGAMYPGRIFSSLFIRYNNNYRYQDIDIGIWECEELYIDFESYKQLIDNEGVVYVELKLKGEQPFKGVVKVVGGNYMFIYPAGEENGAIVISTGLCYKKWSDMPKIEDIAPGYYKVTERVLLKATVEKDDYYKKYTGKVFEIQKAIEYYEGNPPQ
ncbi:MAG: hypothetical protein IJW13_00235 [Clostridia bacterium]|nr:hypothetical protein [Clostridia bacterium]